jgi:N-acetyl sugar amidotransferase
MDTSDPEIFFSEKGICNHCELMEQKALRYTFPKEILQNHLDSIISEIKSHGGNKKYNCLIGVSGGVDSTYVAYLVKKLGLRPLAVHLDNGWNTVTSISNINNALKTLDIDLLTIVLDWTEFRDIQLSFLKASTPDSEIPTDHAIYAVLRKVASENNIKYIIDGVNYATETIMPKSWSQGYSDWKYIKILQNKYGTCKLKTYPHYTFLNLFYYKRIKSQKTISILNYIEYNKADVKNLLIKQLNWKDYGGKHYESLYTRFFQAYILPTKFGFDKRRAHLSTLINSNQITREEALKEISLELYDEGILNEHKMYIAKKLEISLEYFNEILSARPKKYRDYRPKTKYSAENLEEIIFNRYNPFCYIKRKLKKYYH